MTHEPAVRRRGEALEQAIIAAAWEEIEAVGFTKLTMEGVAKRAGTSKPVLYRRWSDRTELLIACAASRMPTVDDILDTGSLRGDVIELLTQLRERMSKIGPMVIVTMVDEVTRDPSFRRNFLHKFIERLLAVMNEAVLERAIERGEITAELLTERIRRLPIDLTRNEFLITGAISDEAIRGIVDEVFLPALQGRRSAQAAVSGTAAEPSARPRDQRSDRPGVTETTAGDRDANAARDLV